ncbi:PspC domain-containing protein [Euzebya sp.]|uniref:ATP-binding protein n=1 Tax=Euzebya sp. TaxID=1971409 RepID=UPI00351370DE
MRSWPTPEALRIARPTRGRVLAGVAAGTAGRLGVDVLIVRLALVVLATAGGFGAVLYIAAWLWVPEESPDRPVERRDPTARHALAIGFLVAGALLLLRSAGAWWSDTLTWSIALAALGSGVVWTQASERERAEWHAAVSKAVGERALPDASLIGPIRPVIGGSLVVAGVITFLFNSPFTAGDTGAVVDVVIASGVTLVGVGLVIGPWLQRLGSQVADERRERIRSEERAEMAAHLHDSVLQTLALIQRADSHEEVTRLARSQERELRSWLFGRAPDDAPSKLGEAVQDCAAKVEERFGVPVEVVLAGDVALDPSLAAMVEAAGEAMANAARHSGADHVDVFVEVEPQQATVFVRDEGKGFDAAAVAGDRRGLSHSIIGRMHRHGGAATIHSDAGEGTEVELTLPLDGSAEEDA